MTQPEQPTGTELDRLIVAASQTYIAARMARPRNQQAIDAAREELDLLVAMRDAGL